uniref:Terpene synthase metal-binding domain-containing protein n=1 Tax=Populus trichocarpa TaxID=3694 RepID=A0A2K1YJN7_POPTR
MCLSTGEADVFNKYKDDKGNFKENLTTDVKGLLSLYEASYLSAHGEIILDEALVFTETHLKSMVARLVSPLADQVTHALNRPAHGGIVKYEQWYSISFYEQDELHIEPVLKPAKSNFNMLQKLYQEELRNLSKWWKELDFTTKLPFARDRLIECYIVVLGPVYPATILTKSTMLVSILDDIYDVHGTIEELEQFTKMIERWDTSMEDLPDYTKVWFEALFVSLS